ncbi:uncharacterized protein LOC112451834 isoform X1 [Temnothorax curvispinosus]|uniref:Uncharacterized protein LOC112451834 isoform X1 n=2 Tax=Temnothorax curvispinosus TaxID=300111 RepID=A0A6J1PDB3_9HYME|nr:uncharacterized protein LOC112451834 isoform X1 [Temnothorax curvispinosus]
MRCFESFFKHTWRPQQVHQVHQMDLSSKFEPRTKKTAAEVHRHLADRAGETTELGEVRVTAPSSNVATSMPSTAHPNGNDAAAPCKNGGCKVWRSSRVDGGELRPESPWHSLKTVFLISVILAFLLWIIVYTLLDQYRIL